MRKTLNDKEAAQRLSNTMQAISTNMDKPGKMRTTPDTSPLFRLPADYDPALGLDNDGMSALMVAWLKLQGVTLVFDDSAVRQTLDQGVTRLEKLLPKR